MQIDGGINLQALATTFDNDMNNLEQLAEEAGEIVRIKSKVFRFGIDDFHPVNLVDNRTALAREIGNLLMIADLLVQRGVIRHSEIVAGYHEKAKKLNKYYDYATSELTKKQLHE